LYVRRDFLSDMLQPVYILSEANMQETKFKVLATRCGSCGCGCPTIMEAGDSGEVVIIGLTQSDLLAHSAVTAKTGEGEAAVVIPKSLLLEALKALG
jgi:hypothetical protein